MTLITGKKEHGRVVRIIAEYEDGFGIAVSLSDLERVRAVIDVAKLLRAMGVPGFD